MTTLKSFIFNYTDLAFMRDQIKFRPLFDANGKPIVNWDGVGPIYDARGNLLWDGTGMSADQAMAAWGTSFLSYTASQGIRNIDGLANNLFNPDWGNTDLPFMQRTKVIFDKYLKPLDANDPNAFYGAKFATPQDVALADYTKTEANLTQANVTDYTPRMISRTVTTADVTFVTEPGGTHLVKDANGFTSVADYGMLQALGQQDNQPTVNADGSANTEWFIGATNPGVAPVNGWFVLFGQFFDHGLDFVGKGSDGTKITINLAPDDPMYGVIDPTSGRPATKIVISRADVSGFADDGTPLWVNHTSPYIDQSQTYGSHDQLTTLLREWVQDPVSGDWKPGMNMLDGYTSTEWTNAWGEATQATLPTLNELRAHLIATGRDDLTWEDVLNLRTRDAAGHVVDSDANTGGIQAVKTGAALLLDMNPRFDGVHFGNPLNPDAGAAFDANIQTLSGAAQQLGCTFGYDANAATIYLDVPAGMMGPGSPASHLTGASALYFWVNFGDFSIKNSMAMGPSIVPVSAEVHDAVSDLLMAAVGDHYIAGDGRTNENIGLTAVHHVFHEEHNYQTRNIIEAIKAQDAREVALDEHGAYHHDVLHDWQVNTGHQDAAGNYVYANGDIAWDAEKVFQAAKMTVEMEYQHTAVDQFARTITPNLHEFVGYNSGENSTISLDFAQVAYRFGHSTLRESIDHMDPTGNLSGSVMRLALEQAFLTPEKFAEIGAGAIALGMTHQQANEIDEFLTPALNQGLLGQPLDLAAINIARGRDLGIPTLNDMREALQLTRYTSWADFGANMIHPDNLVNFIAAYSFDGDVSRAHVVLALANDEMLESDPANVWGYTVEGAVNFLNNTDANLFGVDGFEKIDCWLGGLAEVHVTGGLLGETFDTIFVDQIGRLMDGDRFYYLQRLSNINYGQEIIDEQFKDIIERTTGVRHLNGSAFAYADQYLDLAAQADATADIAAATAARDVAQAAYDAAHTATVAANAVVASTSAELATAQAAAASDAPALRAIANTAQAQANAINATAELGALLTAIAVANTTDATALQAAANAAQATANATDAALLQAAATAAAEADAAAAAAQALAGATDAVALQAAAVSAAADDQAAADAISAAALAAQAEADAAAALAAAQTTLDGLIANNAPQVDIDAATVVRNDAQTVYNAAVLASDTADQAVIDAQAIANATDAALLQAAATAAAMDDAAAVTAQALADATDAPALQAAATQAVADDAAAAAAQAAATAAASADAAVTPVLNAYMAAAAIDQAADAAAVSADATADAAEAADAALAAATATAVAATNAATAATAAEAAALAALNAAQAELTALQANGNAKTQHKYAAQLAANMNLGIFSDGGSTTGLNGNVVDVGGIQYIRDVRTPSIDTKAGNAAGFALDGAPNSGAESHEVIVASDRDDLIYARGGDDTVYGEDGRDRIYGGNGIDRLYGGDGDDTIYGDDGGDLIDGGLGDDVLFGGQSATAAAGLDQVIGSEGNDYVDGGIGIDKLSGSAGDDVIFGGGDTDAFTHGGDGNDYIDGGVTGDLLWGDGGTDLIVGQADQDIVAGMDGDDILRPGPLSQSLTGGGDEVMGGDGLTDRGENGKGVGFDLIDLSDWQAAPVGAMIDFSTQQNPAQAIDGNPKFPAWVGIEGAIGSRNDDTFLGDDNSNWLIGGSGNDVMTGGLGNDLVIGDGVRLDTLIGTYASAYGDTFDGASHRATGFLQHNGVLDAVGWGDQKHLGEMLKSAMFKDMVLGGSQITQIWRNGVVQTTGESAGQIGDGGVAGAADIVAFAGQKSEYVISAVLFDVVTRSVVNTFSANTIVAVKVKDTVAGRDGEDIVLGVEKFRFSNGNGGTQDFLLGQVLQLPATGMAFINDITPLQGQTLTVDTTTIADFNGVGAFSYQWQRSANGGTSWNNITGATSASFALPDAPGTSPGQYFGDLLRIVVTFTDGAGQLETIRSAATAPVGVNYSAASSNNGVNFSGRGGDDVIVGSDQGDQLTGMAGNDTISGGDGGDQLFGGAGDDVLDGGRGDDTLNGGAGDDVLIGGRGNDILGGGTGNDRVDFTGGLLNYTITTNGTDIIFNDTVGNEGADTLRNVEVMRFGAVDYAIVMGDNAANTALNGALGAAGSQAIFGLSGADVLNGGAASDILVGGAGNDTVNGGEGDDFIFQTGSTDGSDFVDGGAGTDTYVLQGSNGAETFRIYTRAAALAAGMTGLNADTEIVITRNGTSNGAIIAQLDNIEEIKINSLNVTADNGNGNIDGGSSGGDTIIVAGDFTQTSLHYSTITVEGTGAGDTIDISGLTSAHRLVFDSNGGADTFIGNVRAQDVINGTLANDLRTTTAQPVADSAPAVDSAMVPSFGLSGGLDVLLSGLSRQALRDMMADHVGLTRAAPRGVELSALGGPDLTDLLMHTDLSLAGHDLGRTMLADPGHLQPLDIASPVELAVPAPSLFDEQALDFRHLSPSLYDVVPF